MSLFRTHRNDFISFNEIPPQCFILSELIFRVCSFFFHHVYSLNVHRNMRLCGGGDGDDGCSSATKSPRSHGDSGSKRWRSWNALCEEITMKKKKNTIKFNLCEASIHIECVRRCASSQPMDASQSVNKYLNECAQCNEFTL